MSRPTDRRVRLSDYFIDKYEVSNQDYKEFINAGGYVKREFWSHPFLKDGRSLSWDEAMALFVDRTGLPGPRQWSNQSVPEGQARWFCSACMAGFFHDLDATPEACPQGHPREVADEFATADA